MLNTHTLFRYVKGTRQLTGQNQGQNITLFLSLYIIGVSIETVFTLIFCLTTYKQQSWKVSDMYM